MEKKEANKEPFNRPDGVEVKLTAKSINIRGFLFFFILFLIGSYLSFIGYLCKRNQQSPSYALHIFTPRVLYTNPGRNSLLV